MEMEKLIAQFPKHISDALEIARNHDFTSLSEQQIANVVICGMGGSGIGGKLVKEWFEATAKVPIVLVQDYDVPAFINGKTLVIASSYSGNTEETLSAVKAAAKKGAQVVGITSGGQLMKFCQANGYGMVKLPGGNPPRSMVAFSVLQLIAILSGAGIIAKDALSAIEGCKNLITKELVAIKTEAKELAKFAHKKQLIIYSPSFLEGVAIRCRQQVNENAKQLCWHHVIPEMNHNELVGWAGGTAEHAVVYLDSNFMNERNRLRYKLNQEIIGKKTPHNLVVTPKGKSIIEEAFYLIHLIDWSSVYLSEMNQVDPVEVRVIDYLKGELAK
jgi:glucose/mannose-6-phosphate isomerase